MPSVLGGGRGHEAEATRVQTGAQRWESGGPRRAPADGMKPLFGVGENQGSPVCGSSLAELRSSILLFSSAQRPLRSCSPRGGQVCEDSSSNPLTRWPHAYPSSNPFCRQAGALPQGPLLRGTHFSRSSSANTMAKKHGDPQERNLVSDPSFATSCYETSSVLSFFFCKMGRLPIS